MIPDTGRAERSLPVLIIRNETKEDYETVEEITRKAFYNIHVPGCTEHYLVHIMRDHEDFIPELDFVAEREGQVIGNIMYTKARLVDETGKEKPVLTFGPVSILPEYQRMGYGKELMEYSFRQAASLGHDVIVIFGSPANYVSRGFKSCKKYNICTENGKFPAAMMVKELVPHALDGRRWIYYDSPVMAVSEEEAKRYDDTLEAMKKEHRSSQEEFYIMSQSFLV
ncbi:MAG: N-acetyltransferase [Lachnospiraceae bacterium]|nr:N-acetyltransferase [Lachnospiraceae bacterium]